MNDMVNHIDAFSQGYNDHTGQLIYSESHDEGRVVYEAIVDQGNSEEIAYNKSLLGAAVLLTSEGTPMLYHGQEFGQNGTSNEGEYISPQPLQWGNLDTESGEALFNKYANLIDFRKNSDALKGNYTEFKLINSQDKILVYWRVSGDDKVVVVANFDSNIHYLDIEFPHEGEWYNILDETFINIDSNWYGGFQATAHSAYVFSLPQEESCVLGDVSGDGAINVLDVVQTVNYVLSVLEFNDDQICSADMNVDGTINVLDIVTLVNYILSN
jgi:1,4-alpha-glucan branching enzyme